MASRRQHFIQRREAVGHTQESLAEALGVDRTSIDRGESGRCTPQPWMRHKLAGALRVFLDQLAVLLTAHQVSPTASSPTSTSPSW